jgi:hypothetical protein
MFSFYIATSSFYLDDRFDFISGKPAVVMLARASKFPTAEALLRL